MKSFLKSLGGRADDDSGLVGQQLQVGPFVVKVEAKLADGGYASIFSALDVERGTAYALKQLRVRGSPEVLEEVKAEARTMQQLRGHPNILRLLAVVMLGPKGAEDCLMLLDRCEYSLVDAARRQLLGPRAALEAFRDACQAVAHMHSQSPPVAHRDIKPENLLRHPSGRWVLCDFGSATTRAQAYSGSEIYIEEENIRKYTTPAYRAPEMWDLFRNDRVDTQADIWALGCLLYWLVFAKLAFTGESKLGVLNGNFTMPPTGGTELVRSLIQDMLVVDPKNRPDITVVLARVEHILSDGASGQEKQQEPLTPSPPPPVPDSERPPRRPQTPSAAEPQATEEQWFADFESPAAQEAPPPPAASADGWQSAGASWSAAAPGRQGGDDESSPPPETHPTQEGAHHPAPGPSQAAPPAPDRHPTPEGPPATGDGRGTGGGQAALEVEGLRQRLAETLAENSALKRRVSQLESLLRSQAATIAALHAVQQNPEGGGLTGSSQDSGPAAPGLRGSSDGSRHG